jgi:hypothetical protein
LEVRKISTSKPTSDQFHVARLGEDAGLDHLVVPVYRKPGHRQRRPLGGQRQRG